MLGLAELGESMTGASTDGDVQTPAKSSRITRIGYFAIGLSIVAALGLWARIVAANSVDLFVWVESLPEDGYVLFYGTFDRVILFFSVAAVVVDIIAGTRGRGNRIAGVVGGLLVLSPFLYMLAVVGVTVFYLSAGFE